MAVSFSASPSSVTRGRRQGLHPDPVLDCFSRHVWARLYTSKMPVTAVQILNNHALPSFEAHAVKVQTVLSDNGREYCGRPDKHPYELFLQLEEIEHRATKVGRAQSNGFH